MVKKKRITNSKCTFGQEATANCLRFTSYISDLLRPIIKEYQHSKLKQGLDTLVLTYWLLSRTLTTERKGKAVPLQAWKGPEGSRKLRFPDYVTTAQDGGRLSALRTGRLYLQEILLVLISFTG